jgi:hypothetical protein
MVNNSELDLSVHGENNINNLNQSTQTIIKNIIENSDKSKEPMNDDLNIDEDKLNKNSIFNLLTTFVNKYFGCINVNLSVIETSAGDAPTGDAPTGDVPTGHAPTGDVPTGHAPIVDVHVNDVSTVADNI